MVERMTLNHVVAGSIPAVGVNYHIISASIVQWLEFVPSKHEVRVRFPVDAYCGFSIESIMNLNHNYRGHRACGVTVSTVDSESTDPGSNPGRPTIYSFVALVAQWIAHWTSNPEVAGSNPVKSVKCLLSALCYI